MFFKFYSIINIVELYIYIDIYIDSRYIERFDFMLSEEMRMRKSGCPPNYFVVFA